MIRREKTSRRGLLVSRKLFGFPFFKKINLFFIEG